MGSSGEGGRRDFVAAEPLDRLEGEALVAFRYADGNRNGAARDIAGILSPNLRVLGMMPDPENQADPLRGGGVDTVPEC